MDQQPVPEVTNEPAPLPEAGNVQLNIKPKSRSRWGDVEEEEPTEIDIEDVAHRLCKTDIEAGSLYVFGARRSGKSHFVKWLLYYMTAMGKEYDCVVLISGTTCTNQFPMIPRKYHFQGWNSETAKVIDTMIDTQKDILQHNSECTTESEKKVVPECLVILDDVLGGTEEGGGQLWTGSKANTLQTLYFQGRHLRISVWLLSQVFRGFSRVRSNADLIIDWRSPSHTQRKDLRDSHGSCKGCSPDDIRASDRFLEKTWKGKHGCQIIDLAGSHGKHRMSDYIYSCTAPADDVPVFGVSPPCHWTVDKS